MARILVVSYAFPPLRGAESTMTMNYVVNLPKRGYEVTVLTGVPHLREMDSGLNSQLPENTLVYRVESLEDQILALVSHLNPANEREITNLSTGGTRGDFKGGLLILDTFRRLKLIPNHVSGWAFFAAVKGKKLLKKHRIDYIVSRSNPVTSHLTALKLKRTLGTPWVACFSDPWTLDPNPPYYDRFWPPELLRGVNEYLEKKIMEKADRLVFTTQEQKAMYAKKYQRFEKKFVVIPNSYNSNDYPRDNLPDTPDKRDRRFVIVHTGSLIRERSPEPFFKALKLLKDENSEILRNIRVVLVGESSGFSELISKYELDDVVCNTGSVTRKEALEHLYKADLLLLIDAPSTARGVFLPSKLLDYIQTNKPILAITPEGPAADLVRRTQTGAIVTTYDPEEIGSVLAEYYRAYINGESRLQPNWEEIQEYSIDRCVQRFVKTLEELRLEEDVAQL